MFSLVAIITLSILLFLFIILFIISTTTNQEGASGASGQSGTSGGGGQTGQQGVSGQGGPSGQNGAPGQSGPSGQAGQQGQSGASGQPGQPGQSGASGGGAVQTSRIIPITPLFLIGTITAGSGEQYVTVLSGNYNLGPNIQDLGDQASFVADASGTLTNLQLYAKIDPSLPLPTATAVVFSVWVSPAGLNPFVETVLSVTVPVDSAKHQLTSSAVVPVQQGDRILYAVHTQPFDASYTPVIFNSSFVYTI